MRNTIQYFDKYWDIFAPIRAGSIVNLKTKRIIFHIVYKKFEIINKNIIIIPKNINLTYKTEFHKSMFLKNATICKIVRPIGIACVNKIINKTNIIKYIINTGKKFICLKFNKYNIVDTNLLYINSAS